MEAEARGVSSKEEKSLETSPPSASSIIAFDSSAGKGGHLS